MKLKEVFFIIPKLKEVHRANVSFFYLYSQRDPEEWVGWKNVKEAFVFFTIRSLFKAHSTCIINVICIFLISIILISLVFIVFFQRNCLVDLCSGDRYWLEIGELRRGLRGGGVQWRGGLGGCRQPAGETRGDLNIEEIKSGWGIGREVSPCFLWRREWAEGGETPPVGVCGGEACSCAVIVWSSARSECPGKQEVLGRGRPCRSKGRKEEEARLDGHRILPILVTIYTHTPFLDTIYTSTRPAYTQAPWSPFNVRAKIHAPVAPLQYIYYVLKWSAGVTSRGRLIIWSYYQQVPKDTTYSDVLEERKFMDFILQGQWSVYTTCTSYVTSWWARV